MRALSIIGIILSLGGILASLVIMTEAKCYCYCDDDYLFNSSRVPGEAVGGSLITMLIFIFFLVFSIISTAVSFAKKSSPITVQQPVVPFQPQPVYPSYPQYGQNYPQYNQPNPNYPSQNNPYQNPNPYNPNPYNPPPPQNPPDPYKNQNPPPPAPDPNPDSGNPWAPK
jgi:hypothetical protein